MESNFRGRIALVTGGSRGIGRATAILLAREGADVAIGYVRRQKEAEGAVAEIRELVRRAVCIRCDVMTPEDVAELVLQTRVRLGPIDFLVHCAAICNLCDHTELTYDR